MAGASGGLASRATLPWHSKNQRVMAIGFEKIKTWRKISRLKPYAHDFAKLERKATNRSKEWKSWFSHVADPFPHCSRRPRDPRNAIFNSTAVDSQVITTTK